METVSTYYPEECGEFHEVRFFSKLMLSNHIVDHRICEETFLKDRECTHTLNLSKNNIVSSDSKNFHLWRACRISDILRKREWDTFSPQEIEGISLMLMEELCHVKNKPVNHPDYALCLCVLETVAKAKSLNVCLLLDNPFEILYCIFELMFKIISHENAAHVHSSILDILDGLLSELYIVPKDVIIIILQNIVEPVKLSNPSAYNLAKELIMRCMTTLKTSIHNFLKTVVERQENDSDSVYENRCREVESVEAELSDIYKCAEIAENPQEKINSQRLDESWHKKEDFSANVKQEERNESITTTVEVKERSAGQDITDRENAEVLPRPRVSSTQLIWHGSVKFKSLCIPITFYSIKGRPDDVGTLLTEQTEFSVRKKSLISQVSMTIKEMTKTSESHEIFLCVPSSKENALIFGKLGSSTKVQFSHLVTYLKQNDSAAVVNLKKNPIPNRRVLSYLCIFPPCPFSSELFQKYCPSFDEGPDSWQGRKDYLVVVAIPDK